MRRHRVWSLVALLIGSGGIAGAQAVSQQRVAASLRALEPRLIAFRRDLHRHPELSGAERRTSERIAAALRAAGIETRTGIGGYGVVGIVRGAQPGPVVAYRADIDAFPSDAPDPVTFRSTTPGVRHICGHDVHTAIGIGLATAFAQQRRQLAGTIVFVFQPAEERATGAHAMLDAGLFGDLTPVAIYGLHTAPLPVGEMAVTSGDMMSGYDDYRVTIRHTDAGERQRIATLVRDRITALGTVPPDAIFAPTAPDFAVVPPPSLADSGGITIVSGRLTTTSLRRPALQREMQALSALSAGQTTVSAQYTAKAIAGVFNDATLTERATAAASQALGAGHVQPVPTIIPAFSEDFGAYQDRLPGVFFFLGVANPSKGIVGMPHLPDYVADERAILSGARAMAAVLLDRLSQP
jgi:metal-dependent amidase/aminoacylase/carboxypeptidase family protein